jgi:hypothetical protein
MSMTFGQYLLAPEVEESGQDFTEHFNTPLSPEEQSEFNKRFSKNDLYNYDMQGWFKANKDSPHEGHYPDTWKKPNHPTFSDQSMYHGNDFQGGHWDELGEGRYGFTPGPTNLQMHGYKNLNNYFRHVEGGNVLNPGEVN